MSQREQHTSWCLCHLAETLHRGVTTAHHTEEASHTWTGDMCVCVCVCVYVCARLCVIRYMHVCVCVSVCVWVCVNRHTCDALLQVFVEGTGADLQKEGRVKPLEGFNPTQPGQNDVHILS